MLCSCFIRYPNYAHKIPNVSTGLIFWGLILEGLLGYFAETKVQEGAYIRYFTVFVNVLIVAIYLCSGASIK